MNKIYLNGTGDLFFNVMLILYTRRKYKNYTKINKENNFFPSVIFISICVNKHNELIYMFIQWVELSGTTQFSYWIGIVQRGRFERASNLIQLADSKLRGGIDFSHVRTRSLVPRIGSSILYLFYTWKLILLSINVFTQLRWEYWEGCVVLWE